MPLKQKESLLLSNVRRAWAQQDIVSDELGMFCTAVFIFLEYRRYEIDDTDDFWRVYHC